MSGALLFASLCLSHGLLAGSFVDADRVKTIAALLPAQPTGLGPQIGDRAAWAELAKLPALATVVADAEKLLGQPLPAQPDELYLEFSRNGNRTHFQDVAFGRRGRLTPLVLAECLEAKGRFVPRLVELIDATAAEKTWVLPAHDSKLTNYRQQITEIDLFSSAYGWNLATADWLLGDRLPPAARTTLRDNVRRRVVEPYLAMIDGRQDRIWWMTGDSNWNAVCYAGSVGTTLALAESLEERAKAVAAAEVGARRFLSGFTADGYCSEGFGYWGYGFGNFVMLSETIRRATSGRIELLAAPEAAAPARFGANIQIQHGVCPAFADCPVRGRPDSNIMTFLNQRFHLDLAGYEQFGRGGSVPEAMILAATRPEPGKLTAGELRTWFKDAGILIGRPAPHTACDLGVALKGGHNAELHNHNDVGSYVVVVGDQPVLLDPGAETYTARTFSSHRYDSKMLNSYGHAVPVVAGVLQKPGRDAAAKILATEFTPTTDTLKLDLAAAYPVPDLTRLERTFVYSRAGAGSLTVTDTVELKAPQTFGTALITLGQYKQLAPKVLLVHSLGETVRVTIDTGGQPFRLEPEQIHEDAPVTPLRLGLTLTAPVTAATITVTIVPEPEPAGGSLLRNGGFELDEWYWSLSHDAQAQSEISTEQAFAGQKSLKITDTSTTTGTNILSARIPLGERQNLELRGQVFHVSGQGIGYYLRCYDATGREVTPSDGHGGVAPAGVLKGQPGKWTAFALPYQTPPGTVSARLWIHSMNAAQVTAYLDELEVVRK